MCHQFDHCATNNGLRILNVILNNTDLMIKTHILKKGYLRILKNDFLG